MTTKLKAYYAHPMALYRSPVEARDLKTLEALGFKVVNPADPKYSEYQMDEFVKLAVSCDLVAFRSFDDGKVGSGVALEVMAAKDADIPVVELSPFLFTRVLSRNETRRRMCLPPLRHPDTAPITFSDDEPLDQDWGNS